MEKLLILTGSLVGSLRIEVKSQATSLHMLVRKGDKGAYHACLVDGRGALSVAELDASYRGFVARALDVHAVLIFLKTPNGVTVMAEGGFTGRKEMLERAKRDLRLLFPAALPLAPSASPAPMPAVLESPALENRIQVPQPEKEARAPQAPQPAQASSAPQAGAPLSNPIRAGDVRQSETGRADAPGGGRQEAFFPPAQEKGGYRALDEILKKADELFRPLDAQAQAFSADPAPQDAVYNPFPDAFPTARWKKVNYPGTGRFYLEGEQDTGGARFLIHALPGEYAPVAPMRRRGFTRFLRAMDGGGYWVRVQRR